MPSKNPLPGTSGFTVDRLVLPRLQAQSQWSALIVFVLIAAIAGAGFAFSPQKPVNAFSGTVSVSLADGQSRAPVESRS